MGLVARRLWSKRGILFGSFLGATLVTALLVIVPLYESSVQAVDLLFTLRGAPASDVDITATANTNSYSGSQAAANRELVTTEWNEWVVEWYPSMIERSQSREFVVIPIDGSVDWLGNAEAWRDEVDALVAAGTEPEELPAPPYPTPPQEATQTRFFTAPDLADHLSVVSGEYPATLTQPPSGFATALPVVLGADLAATIQRQVGDQFVVKPFSGFPFVFEIVEVAAIVEPVDGNAAIWGIDDPGEMVYLPQETWDAWTSSLPIDPDDDPWRRTSRGLTEQTVRQRFVLQFDPSTVELEELNAVANGVVGFRSDVSRDSGGEIAANSFLDNLLVEFTTRSVTIGGPILAVLALVVGGALYFLVYTAALTLEREGPELALLKTRGASSWQTIGIHIAQSLGIAAIAAAVAPWVARTLVALTGRVPPLSDLTGGEPLRVAQVRSIVPFVVAGAVLTFVAMGLAILPFARRSVLELRSLAARPAQSSVWQRYNLDLFAIGISLVILFQLTQRGFINTTEGEVKLDPLAIIFPALLLFTGALVLLRLLPWVLRFVGWIMTKARSMAAALPGWHLGRNPIPYGRLALLVWLTTGLGAFALTYAHTLDTSFNDRAAFVAGADVRVVADEAGFLSEPEGSEATPVLRTAGAPRQSSRQAEVLAIQPEEFADIVTWRSDFGESPEAVFGPLRADGPPDLGAEVPDGGVAFRLDGVVVPLSLAEQAALGANTPDQSLRLMLKVFDAHGRVWTMQADQDLVDTEWRTVEVDLTTGLNTQYPTPPEPPFAIHAMWLERSDQSGGVLVADEQILVSDMRIGTASGDEIDFTAAIDELQTTNGIRRFRDADAGTALDALYAELPEGVQPPTNAELAASPLARDGTATRWVLPSTRTRINTAVPSFRRIPDDFRVLLDEEVATRAGLGPGDTSSYSISGQIFNGVMVGSIDRVPTMNDGTREGSMVIDLDAYTAWTDGIASWSFNTQLGRLDAPGEMWVKTDDPDAALRRIAAALPVGTEPDQVFTIEGTTSEFSSRPVQVGLVAILFVGAATSVVLALAGVTGYVLLAVARRAREMGVLRALGLQRREVAATFALEQVVVVGLGAVIGTLGGIALMWTMIPFLQLGEAAEVVEPPIQLAVPWSSLLLYIALVGGLLILSVVWSTRRVSARRMSEVLREVER
jgi:hypothetical protein